MPQAVVRTGQVSALLTGTTIKHLPQERPRSVRLPVPTVDEQQRAAADPSALDEHANRLTQQPADLPVPEG